MAATRRKERFLEGALILSPRSESLTWALSEWKVLSLEQGELSFNTDWLHVSCCVLSRVTEDVLSSADVGVSSCADWRESQCVGMHVMSTAVVDVPEAFV